MSNSVGLKLGSLSLDVPFFRASLSGYSNYAMRTLVRRFGCPFTVADMMLAKSAACPRVLRKTIFRPGSDEHPIGVQILSRKPGIMAKAARDLGAVGYDVIDLNFACQAPKALRRGLGGALLNDPDAVIDILKAVCIFRNFAVGYVCRHPRRRPVLISFMKARTRADVENAINTWYTNRNPGA